MSNKILYHGSEKIVETPKYHFQESNRFNDYGLGFYCTQNLDMAKEWANRKILNGFVNKYEFDERGLKILDLTDKTKFNVLNWISILIHNRNIDEDDKDEFEDALNFLGKYYINVEDYDVVIGYRADDAYFRFPLMFVKNILTYEKLEEIYNLGNLGKRYVLISEKAINRIKFINYVSADPIFHEKYILRKNNADNKYRQLEKLERKAKGTRVRDLMEKEND